MFEKPAPPEDASPLAWLLYEQDGVLTRRQALAHLSPSAVRRSVDRNRWRTWGHGVLVTHNGPLTREQQLWVAVLGAGRGALLAGSAAAEVGGLRWRPGATIDVLVPASRRPTQADLGVTPVVVIRRSSAVPAKDVCAAARPPRTLMPRSLVDAAQWSRTDDEARAVLAAGCQQRLVTPDEIREVLHRMPRAHRRSLMRETLDFADRGVLSTAEIDFVRLCRKYRLPPPDHQVVRRDANGRARYLDVYWRAYRLHVEIDGAWHVEVSQWWDDMRRQNEVWIRGDRILRFPAWVVREHPAEVAAQVRAALNLGNS